MSKFSEKILKEYNYETNKWYDATKNDRPKVSVLLVKFKTPGFFPYSLCYPNADKLIQIIGKIRDYSEAVAWLIPDYQDEREETLDVQI